MVEEKLECIKFYGVHKRIASLNLTANPSDGEIDQCTYLEYDEGHQITSHLYDFINNPNYIVRKPFMFLQAFKILSENKHLISGLPMNAKANKGKVSISIVRPVGTKKPE